MCSEDQHEGGPAPCSCQRSAPTEDISLPAQVRRSHQEVSLLHSGQIICDSIYEYETTKFVIHVTSSTGVLLTQYVHLCTTGGV